MSTTLSLYVKGKRRWILEILVVIWWHACKLSSYKTLNSNKGEPNIGCHVSAHQRWSSLASMSLHWGDDQSWTSNSLKVSRIGSHRTDWHLHQRVSLRFHNTNGINALPEFGQNFWLRSEFCCLPYTKLISTERCVMTCRPTIFHTRHVGLASHQPNPLDTYALAYFWGMHLVGIPCWEIIVATERRVETHTAKPSVIHHYVSAQRYTWELSSIMNSSSPIIEDSDTLINDHCGSEHFFPSLLLVTLSFPACIWMLRHHTIETGTSTGVVVLV